DAYVVASDVRTERPECRARNAAEPNRDRHAPAIPRPHEPTREAERPAQWSGQHGESHDACVVEAREHASGQRPFEHAPLEVETVDQERRYEAPEARDAEPVPDPGTHAPQLRLARADGFDRLRLVR